MNMSEIIRIFERPIPKVPTGTGKGFLSDMEGKSLLVILGDCQIKEAREIHRRVDTTRNGTIPIGHFFNGEHSTHVLYAMGDDAPKRKVHIGLRSRRVMFKDGTNTVAWTDRVESLDHARDIAIEWIVDGKAPARSRTDMPWRKRR